MPNEPGVRVRQEEIGQVIQPAEAELPTCIVGRLYHVVNNGLVEGSTFDPLEEDDQAFLWPEKKIGTVVDLAGTRNGLIDSQRRDLADFVPSFNLVVDGDYRFPINDKDVVGLNQDGFLIKPSAKDHLHRTSVNAFVVQVDGQPIVYNPDGGLSEVRPGDRFKIGQDRFTVVSSTDSKMVVSEDVSGSSSNLVRYESSDTVDLSITPSTIDGRVIIEISGESFMSADVEDLVVVGVPMGGLTSMTGTLNGTMVSGLNFGTAVSFEEVQDNVVRVVNGSEVYFSKVVELDSLSGVVMLDDPVGQDGNVSVTFMRSQIGYVESYSPYEIVAVVPESFSDSLGFVELSSDRISFNVYPEFEVEASYRALRKDLVNESFSASSLSELLESVGHTSVDYNDGLLFAVNLAINAQPTEANVYFIPVDDEPDGHSGLSENRSIEEGYQLALEAAESIDVYNIVTLDRSPAIYSALESHVLSMSTEEEGAWRRGFMYEPVPSGRFESTSGEVSPGRVVGGIGGNDSGNKVIRDKNIDFVTEAGVKEGTKVVITFPEQLAGEYQALGTTTDNDLILDGIDFDIYREFNVPVMDVETIGGLHQFSGAATGQFSHVEPGDYVEAEIDNNVFRMKVTLVSGDGTMLEAQDEVPTEVSFPSGTTASNVSIIRSWDTVRYHISPLSKEEQVEELINRKSVANRRFTVTLDYSPTMVVGSDESGNPVRKELNPSLSLCGIAAKRSGLRAFDEVSNLFVGGGVEGVSYGYAYFKRSQMRRLSDAGFTLLTQKSRDAQPYIRDMITSDTSSIVTQEEIVTAGADWQSKSLTRSFQSPPGQRFQIIDDWLMGLRAIQADAILKSWVGEGRLTDYELVSVGRNDLNKRQTDIVYIGYFPVAEKEIEFTIQITV